ncbi:hypothetical protein HHK36_008904 [Tetracentron sinense]|uniref:DNA (cytosine-5)-methyltransferase n=1 Tax=Tetracentron sinense TaxID=13715 RepID=A0A835DGZ0_TETSI|nr:hypothetical protein HHK36_008904 [Tetracentron sinense]
MEADKGTESDPNETSQNGSENNEESSGSQKVSQQATAYSEFDERSVHLSEKSSVVITKEEKFVNEEILAVHLTSGQGDPRPRRRLIDFILHDVNRIPQPFEIMKSNNVFISGTIFSLGGSSDIKKEKGIRCNHIGHVESWAISGYEEGSPVISVSTDIADYVCVKPSSSYSDFYENFFEKVRSLVELFMKLSKYSEANLYLSHDELLAEIVGSLSRSKNFSGWASMKDFIFSQGDFLYDQLVGLNNKRPEKNNPIIAELPSLPAVRDRSWMKGDFKQAAMVSSSSSTCEAEEDENAKLVRQLLQEEEHWQSMKHKKSQNLAPASNKFYFKIHENEIANDYPPPAYYKMSIQEWDESIVCHPNKLSRGTLQNWSIYNSDSRLLSLELLPMQPVAEIDVTIYGSGTLTGGVEFCHKVGPNQSSSSDSGAQNLGGIPIYLSTIKEWMIEFEYESLTTFISIRTDLAWYRLGNPSKQYSPWSEPILKTARLAISIITLLNDHCWISQLSFADVIKRVSEFGVDHPAYMSSTLVEVNRYILVHGQIILQLFAEYPNEIIRGCAFLTSLSKNMERHHSKWVVKKKEMNFNPRAAEASVVSKRKVMQATTTRLVKKLWGDYYSKYYPEDSTDGDSYQVKEGKEVEDEQVENEAEKLLVPEKPNKSHLLSEANKSRSTSKEIRWDGKAIGKTCSGEALYKCAIVRGDVIAVKGALAVEVDDSEEIPAIYFVEYMFENSDGKKMIHGRGMQRGSQTILGNAANEREVFLTNECLDFELGDVKQTVVLDIRLMPWGYQYRKDNANSDNIDRAKADDRKRKGLPMEYYCKSLYWPERGAFFSLPFDSMGLGSGFCNSCKIKETHREKENFKTNSSNTGFTYKGSEFYVHDFVYVSPLPLAVDREDHENFRDGQNVGSKAYAVCHLLEIEIPKPPKQAVKVRRFFRPEDISAEKGYSSDIREVYYSEQILNVPVETIRGKCEVRKKLDLPSLGGLGIYDHIFFCEHLYDPAKGAIGQLPDHVRLGSSTRKAVGDAASSKEKCKEGENDSDVLDEQRDLFQKNCLATLEIFSGCGGLTEGLQESGVSLTKWAIESERPPGDAFCLNQPHSMVIINNCNVILSYQVHYVYLSVSSLIVPSMGCKCRAIMEACGDADDCISASEAVELASWLDEDETNSLPIPGQVDFIIGGPPRQGFSRMNSLNQCTGSKIAFNPSTWSKVKCDLILTFLSFADYFRPKFLLLENVEDFVTFNKGHVFHLTIASLLEMGYQVRFGILEAGAYGVSLSRKQAFIWAASPEETLPEWPEPMHVFAGPELKITLPGNAHYAAVRSTASGAPFRAITVRDTIGDLPAVGNWGFDRNLAYKYVPVSWFQKIIRGYMLFLPDHIPKKLNELNFIRCQRIPNRAGADWHDLPDEKVKLSTGQVVDLIPWYLPDTANRNNQCKGQFGRLAWEGNFPSIRDPQPMGMVGMCFHPEQDRIITVRECARSLGFPDSYQFSGSIDHMYRQIGDAVPPPLAFALGRKLKEAVERKRS